MPARVFLVSICLLFTLPQAQAKQSEVEELRAMVMLLTEQVSDLQQRLASVEQHSTQVGPVVAKNQQHREDSHWTENLDFKADFRYRYDEYDDPRDDESRGRDRIRARAELAATLNDQTLIGLGIASGDDDPISTNQTLGANASTKDLRLDLAWFQYQLMDELLWKGGKIHNPVHRVGGHFLVWDGDLRPEGMNLVYGGRGLNGTLGLNHLESDNEEGEQDDVSYVVLQADYELHLGEESLLILGGGYYDIPTSGSNFGEQALGSRNSVDENGDYLYDYQELEGFAELHTVLAGLELSAFVDYVKNLDASEEDTAYALGLRIGKMRRRGSWQLGYTWQETEADAVLGLFNDSDFADGGTDSRGHVLSAGYALSDFMHLQLTYFDTEYGKHSLGEWGDFDRIFVDLNFKY